MSLTFCHALGDWFSCKGSPGDDFLISSKWTQSKGVLFLSHNSFFVLQSLKEQEAGNPGKRPSKINQARYFIKIDFCSYLFLLIWNDNIGCCICRDKNKGIGVFLQMCKSDAASVHKFVYIFAEFRFWILIESVLIFLEFELESLWI